MTIRLDQLRTALIVLLAALLLAFAGASLLRRVGAHVPVLGVDWADTSGGPIVVRVDPSSAAARAGLVEGDRLLQADGRPVETAVEAAQIAWATSSDAPLRLRVRRGNEERAVELSPAWQPRGEPYGYLVLVGLAFLFSGLLTALRWPRVRGGRVYPVLAACLFAQLTLSHTGVADGLDRAIYWGDLLAGALVPALLLHAAVTLARGRVPRRRLILGSAYGTSALLALGALWLSPSGLGGAYRFASPLRMIELRDRLEALALGVSVVVCVVVLVKAYGRTESVMHRSQLRWLLWGLGVGLGPFVALYAVPWALGADELPQWAQFLSVLPMLLVPAAFTATLARYRLQDLDLLLVRGLSEVTTIFCTFTVYAAVVFLVREGVSELLPLSRSAARYVGILVAAVSYPQLRSWVRGASDRVFYRKRYSYRATLLDWARELSAETDLGSLLRRLRTRVCETLGVDRAEVLVRTGPWRFERLGDEEHDTMLELDQASLEHLEKESSLTLEIGASSDVPWARHLYPMKVKGQVRAVLAVADRANPEEPLNSEDRALLGTLAAHAGTAIEAARLVQEVRQRAEEIERLHARQASILESSAIGLLLLDGDGRILAWNRALEAIYDLPRDEAIGRRLEEVFPLHVARRIKIEGEYPRRGEESRIFRLGMVNRGGRELLVNIAISPAEDSGGAGAGGRVVTFDDVTDRVELEKQVMQQERLASLGLLAAGVAHEINTPLTGISSYTQLLLEQSDGNGRHLELLRKIDAQTSRAAKITGSLLTLARPERTEFQELNLNETVREVLQLFDPQIRGKGIRLRADLDERLPDIRGHRGKLQQVLLNLLLNARDALGSSGEILVKTYEREGMSVVEVSDDGAGIAEEDLPRIFDPFFTTKGRGQGTGLGLSITYGIVQEHDGRIRAESRAGGRTRFRVELPSRRAARAVAR